MYTNILRRFNATVLSFHTVSPAGEGLTGYNFIMNIAVIGAGPAGISAALHAAQGGGRVTLFEHNDAPGRKLLVTGSGRCNLTNAAITPGAYYCADPAWMGEFLEAFSLGDMLKLCDDLGVPTRHTDDGWYYPVSGSAQAVVEILRGSLLQRGVKLRVATKVNGITKTPTGFNLSLHTSRRAWQADFDAVVVAAGGRAYPELGSRGELFPALEQLGHTVNPLLPALGPIHVQLGAFSALQGQRFDVLTSMLLDGGQLGQSFGNVIITRDGFNGPGVMNLSHWAALHPGEDLALGVNFIAPYWPDLTEILAHLETRSDTLRALLLRSFAPKVVDFFLFQAGIEPDTAIGALSEETLRKLLQVTAGATFKVTGAGTFKNSQVSVGGVAVGEVDPLTMQSRRVNGLYLVGETLDVAGPCGGFNLHFAFGSGTLAGRQLASFNHIA